MGEKIFTGKIEYGFCFLCRKGYQTPTRMMHCLEDYRIPRSYYIESWVCQNCGGHNSEPHQKPFKPF